jgi:hypothetical protein
MLADQVYVKAQGIVEVRTLQAYVPGNRAVILLYDAAFDLLPDLPDQPLFLKLFQVIVYGAGIIVKRSGDVRSTALFLTA